MPVPQHSPSPRSQVKALLRALLALSLGWLLLPVLAPVTGEGEQDHVLSEAELRAGDQPPTPVAEAATGEAAPRALSVRIRAGSQRLLATSTSLAAALPLPFHLRALAQGSVVEPHQPTRRVARHHWPLARSSCESGDDPITGRPITRRHRANRS